MLEVGSREVTGISMPKRFSNAEYVGFDFYPGPTNVDVVGDASSPVEFFSGDRNWTVIYSSAVFEHFADAVAGCGKDAEAAAKMRR